MAPIVSTNRDQHRDRPTVPPDARNQRTETNIEIDRPFRPMPGIVLATVIEIALSRIIWTPGKRLAVYCDVVAVGAPRPGDPRAEVQPGDRIVVAPEIGLALKYHGKPALMFRQDEVEGIVTCPKLKTKPV